MEYNCGMDATAARVVICQWPRATAVELGRRMAGLNLGPLRSTKDEDAAGDGGDRRTAVLRLVDSGVGGAIEAVNLTASTSVAQGCRALLWAWHGHQEREIRGRGLN